MINEHYDYVTKAGNYPVTFYTLNAAGYYNIHGFIRVNGLDILLSWDQNGKCNPVHSLTDGKDFDLVKVKYSPKKEKAVIVLSTYPSPLPQRILSKFQGKRVKLTIEEY